jgi:hypothetical protein
VIVVYENKTDHLTTDAVHSQVDMWFIYGADSEGPEISDAAAQTIASWYHSPANPNSTRLSTMGQVTDDMCLDDFVGAAEYLTGTFYDQMILDALESYIDSKQTREMND